jgi:hypothetical protein
VTWPSRVNLADDKDSYDCQHSGQRPDWGRLGGKRKSLGTCPVAVPHAAVFAYRLGVGHPPQSDYAASEFKTSERVGTRAFSPGVFLECPE